jgi:hypothetical protein
MGAVNTSPISFPSPYSFIAMSSWFDPTGVLVVTGVLAYFALVRTLRWRRYDEMHRKFGSKINSLSFEEAQHIVNLMGMYEMPFIIVCSLFLSKHMANVSARFCLLNTVT